LRRLEAPKKAALAPLIGTGKFVMRQDNKWLLMLLLSCYAMFRLARPQRKSALTSEIDATRIADVERYKTHIETRNDYIARARVASEKQDQVLIAGAAGALAISLTFIEKIASHPSSSTMHLLAIAWILLLLALVGAILKYDCRATAYRIAQEELDSEYVSGALPSGRVKKLNEKMENIKNFSIACLCVGVSFLIVFGYMNIPFDN
jgi:hypothetical protein